MARGAFGPDAFEDFSAPRKKVERESSIERYFNAQVKAHGGKSKKMKGRINDPDRIVIWPAAFGSAAVHFVELKRPGGKLRRGQAREMGRLNGMGCTALYLDTRELIDVYVMAWSRCA